MGFFRDCIGFLQELVFFRESPTQEEGSFRELIPYFSYLRPVWRLAALAVTAGIIGSGLKMVIPYGSKIFIDTIVPGQASANGFVPMINTLPGLILLLAVAGAGAILCSLVQGYAQVRFGEEYTFQLQTALFSHVLAFPLSYFRDQRTGYLIARMSGDTGMMQYIFTGVFVQLVTQCATLVLVLGILLSLNAFLVGIILLFVPLFLLINLFFIRRIRQILFEGRDRDASIVADMQEIVAGIEQVKTHTAEKREFARLMQTIRAAIRNRVTSSLYHSISQQAVTVAQGLALVLVFWFGGQDVLAGRMSLGDFVAFSTYIALFGGSVVSILSVPQQLQPAVVSASRISAIFRLEPEWEHGLEAEENTVAPPVKGEIEFRDIAFGYVPGRPLFQHVSLSLHPDTITAIIGRTGAGKTTLMSLLLRFYTPDEGQILLDGVDIREHDPRWLRSRIAVVSQDMYLFHATVAQNIRYSHPAATMEEVREAAVKAGIDEEIRQMPNGYETIVGERGAKLSAGQRQRIGIARAFLKDARILVLDEPTSHLDPVTEQQLEQVLRSLSKGRTTVLITHRHSLLPIAGRVLQLEEGRLDPVDDLS